MFDEERILVCGGTGFIGRNIIESIANKSDQKIFAIHRTREPFKHNQVVWIKANLTNESEVSNVFKQIRPTKVIQAAATTSGAKDILTRPSIHTTDNAVMNSYIFRAAADHEVSHLVFFSCTIMYHPSPVPVREEDYNANDQIHPRYFGAAHTKLYLEKMCEFYANNSNTKFTSIRHSNVYGPHDKFDLNRSHFFGATVSKILTAENEIVVWGNGTEARDLIYVSDLSKFVDLVLRHQKHKFRLYHCGSGSALTVSELTGRMIAVSGRDLKIAFDTTKPTIDFSLSLNCERAHLEVGWKPSVSLEEGIERTFDWWKSNINPTTLMPIGP